MKRTLFALALFALTGAAFANPEPMNNTDQQLLSFDMGHIQVLNVNDPITPLTFTFTSDHWTPGQPTDTLTIDGGTLDYSTNVPSVVNVFFDHIPYFIDSLYLSTDGGETFSNQDRPVMPGTSGTWDLKWRATANLLTPPTIDTVIATYTLMDDSAFFVSNDF